MKKVVVISGGIDGVGKKVAQLLVTDCSGYKVIILSPNKEKIKTVSKEINCEYTVTNISDWEQCDKCIENIVSKYGAVDILINNAGLYIEQELELNDPEHIKKVISVNTLGTIYLTKAAIPFLKSSAPSRIINVISQSGLVEQTGKTVYSASKWAITGFTKCLQLELAKYNINVTGIYPGKINTNMFKKIGIEKDMSNAIDPTDIAKTIQFILSFDSKVVFSGIRIRDIKA